MSACADCEVSLICLSSNNLNPYLFACDKCGLHWVLHNHKRIEVPMDCPRVNVLTGVVYCHVCNPVTSKRYDEYGNLF